MPSPSQLATARARAESMMVDRCTIGTETETLNEETGKMDVVAGPTVYSGKCLLVGASTRPLQVEAGGQQLVLVDAVLKLPVLTSGAVQPGMIAKITAAQHDPSLVGVKLRVEAPHHQTYAKERRFPVEEV